MVKKSLLLILCLGVLAGLGVLLASCSAPIATATACPTCPTAAPPKPCPTAVACPAEIIPSFATLWTGSAHADKKAAAFTHWDTATPAEIPVTCARCHSDPGFKDFTGADGSKAGVMDKAAKIGTVITCETCHNTTTAALTSVTFPSGFIATGLGREAVCMSCHQGTTSMTGVDDAIKKLNLTADDTPSKDLAFVNVHYLAAAATREGGSAKGGYQYANQTYSPFFQHVDGYQTCQNCHDSHSLEVKVDSCKTCHTNVKTEADLPNIRMQDAEVDFNGNGDVKEGIAAEVAGMQAKLMSAIQAYGKNVAGLAIVYDADTYPYFFIDSNANGKGDKDELVSANKYVSFTPRMLKAAYNYHYVVKDPGAYAHNYKYVIELLYDSTADLNTKLAANAVDLSKAHRDSAGHFAGGSMVFRDWDDTGLVPAGCAKCHSDTGLPTFLVNAANIGVAPTDGFACSTCHDNLSKFTRYVQKTVPFPSGAKLTFADAKLDSNLCINCHQGRESTVSLTTYLATYKEADTPSDKIAFRNIHYLGAGATIFGTQAKGYYEYPGQTYLGEFMHEKNLTSCLDCHDAHALEPKLDTCKTCHGTNDPTKIRMNSKEDYNGNGNTTESLKAEFDGMMATLYSAIQAYAKQYSKAAILYDPNTYPYWYLDANANGKVDTGEKTFNAWTPRLLKAAYNLQAATKDPGAYIHNPDYVFQVLYDSITDLKSVTQGVQFNGVRPK